MRDIPLYVKRPHDEIVRDETRAGYRDEHGNPTDILPYMPCACNAGFHLDRDNWGQDWGVCDECGKAWWPATQKRRLT